MRTTVSIDDAVLADAKRRAAEEGRSLSELVTEALRQRLVPRAAADAPRYRAKTAGEGGVLPGVDLTDNAAVRERLDGD